MVKHYFPLAYEYLFYVIITGKKISEIIENKTP